MFIEKTGLTTGTTYKFVIKGKNELGEGEGSDVISIVAATRPNIVNTPTTEIEGTNVKISWIAPLDGGSSITSY